MRRITLIAMAVLAMMALVGAGAAEAQVDTSFGVGGTLRVVPPVPTGWTQSVGAIALGQSGDAYVLSRQSSCPPAANCTTGDFLFHYASNGQLEPGFAGSRGYEVPAEGFQRPFLGVDSAGRPLVARTVESEGSQAVVVRRLLATGQLDTTYGAAGAVSVPCTCGYEGTRLMTAREGKAFIVVPRANAQKPGAAGLSGITLIGLDQRGHRLHGFGTRGVTSVSLPGTEEFTYSSIAPNGALYFGGSSTGSSSFGSWLARVSAKGKLDTAFTKTALKSLHRLGGLAGVPGQVNTMVISHKGKIELFGTAGSAGGFELRLLASGKLDQTFGKKGLRIYPYSIVSAIRGGEGATIALSGEEVTTPRLLRIFGNGNLDKKFGAKGELLPATASKNGLVLEPGGKGAVTVVDHDYTECRSACESTPSLYRVREGK